MKLYIDNREPNDIIDEIKKLNSNAKKEFEIILCNLKLFDFLITNDNFDINNMEIDLENILVAIERKSENDLLSSNKDGRYKEQRARMENLNISNNKIYYLIEESVGTFYKNKDTEKKIIYSAIISLTYFKQFSLLFTKSKLDTAYLIYKFCDKIHSNNNSNSNNSNINLEISKNTELYNKIDLSGNNLDIHDNKNLSNNSYLNNIKLSKKNNITPENIDTIMLMQIPNISSNIADELMKEFNTIQELITSLKNNKTCLQNFKINNRKISKSVIENIIKYLHI